MRRWELVGGGSSKFWEAAVEGACVTVCYGRIGSEGRVQVKALASTGAAEAHFAKLVAEKENKGYTETAAVASEQVGTPQAKSEDAPRPSDLVAPEAGLPDEDTFVMPSSWRRLVLPRRGGVPRVSPSPTWPPTRERQRSVRAHREPLTRSRKRWNSPWPHLRMSLTQALSAVLTPPATALSTRPKVFGARDFTPGQRWSSRYPPR